MNKHIKRILEMAKIEDQESEDYLTMIVLLIEKYNGNNDIETYNRFLPDALYNEAFSIKRTLQS